MQITSISQFRALRLYNNRLNAINKQNSGYIKDNKNISDTVCFSGKIPHKSISTMFDKYEFFKVFTGNDAYNVHNLEILNRIKSKYSSKEFGVLFDFANSKGVFNLDINDKTHYVKTSLIDPKENPLMGKLVWVTDSVRYMPILKDKYPKAAVPLIENMSKFYKKEEKNFNKIINDPILYEFNHDWPNTAKNGIGHVFNPNNLRVHKWFAHTRLDSPALYLQSMCDLIQEGFHGAKYGYKRASEISQNSIDAIANITAYLKAIDYPYAKDTGAWEEKTFNITPSSDVAIINESFRKVIDLMYSKTSNPELLKVRERVLNSKNGKVFADEAGLRQMLNLGEYRIRENSLLEVPNERVFDGAMSFIPHTEKFNDDVIEDARQIISRMERLKTGCDLQGNFNGINAEFGENLVRENGTLRYIGDRYLNMTSGHKINRSILNKDTEAQWFMTSDISKSYGIAAKRLLDKIETDGLKNVQPEALKLFHKALENQTEYINRAYGRITGEGAYKANGKPCPPFQVPEAYQAVRKSDGSVVFVPGSHTPLGWAQSSLYDASKLLMENLLRKERLAI